MANKQHTKLCKDCGAKKPLKEFYTHAGQHEPRCKSCSYSFGSKWRKAAALKRVVQQDGVKSCRLCGVEKKVTAFSVHRQMVGGRAHECRACTNARQKIWRDKAMQRPEFRAARKFSQDKIQAKRYGITLEQYRVLEIMATGKCEICQRPAQKRNSHKADSRLHIDHSHQTGKVRGMLCTDCNRGLGMFSDDPSRLRRAAAYICQRS